jgi:hypothetical protein
MGSAWRGRFNGGSTILRFHNHWWDINDASTRDNETANVNLTQAFTTGAWARTRWSTAGST